MPMPRYFFHVHDELDLPDNLGVELTDEAAAQSQAIIAAGEMLREMGRNHWNRSEWAMDVVDERGTQVCQLKFQAKR